MFFDLPPYPAQEHQARLILGDPVAEAWEWIFQYASSYDLTPDMIVEMALYKRNTWNNFMVSDVVGSPIKGVRISPEFWNKLEKVLGRSFPLEKRRAYFP